MVAVFMELLLKCLWRGEFCFWKETGLCFVLWRDASFVDLKRKKPYSKSRIKQKRPNLDCPTKETKLFHGLFMIQHEFTET